MADEKATPGATGFTIPLWVTELIDILEAIWNELPQSKTVDHPVAQKLAALKAKLPK